MYSCCTFCFLRCSKSSSSVACFCDCKQTRTLGHPFLKHWYRSYRRRPPEDCLTMSWKRSWTPATWPWDAAASRTSFNPSVLVLFTNNDSLISTAFGVSSIAYVSPHPTRHRHWFWWLRRYCQLWFPPIRHLNSMSILQSSCTNISLPGGRTRLKNGPTILPKPDLWWASAVPKSQVASICGIRTHDQENRHPEHPDLQSWWFRIDNLNHIFINHISS